MITAEKIAAAMGLTGVTLTVTGEGIATITANEPVTEATQAQVQAWYDAGAVPDMSDLATVQRIYDLATEKLLNERAGAWGYESMARATTYAQSTNPQWAAEAAALIAHRDAVWLAAYAILADVLAGSRPVPVLADYLAELPAMPARPVTQT